jgi:mannose-6-phosphate isomerase-like protein (cupin superfamily)
MRFLAIALLALVSGLACTRVAIEQRVPRQSVIQYDSTVAVREPGPHNGGGVTTAYSFFSGAKEVPLVFRKRALHPGSAIGNHRNDEDEIYYVLSGRGELTLDGVRHIVGPGTAIWTPAGGSHGLRQLGSEDLVIIISYLR